MLTHKELRAAVLEGLFWASKIPSRPIDVIANDVVEAIIEAQLEAMDGFTPESEMGCFQFPTETE